MPRVLQVRRLSSARGAGASPPASPEKALAEAVARRWGEACGAAAPGGAEDGEAETREALLQLARSLAERGNAAGGSAVTLVGTGFAPDGLACRFGAEVVAPPRARFLSASAIECIAPPAAAAGAAARVEVSVSLNGGADFAPGAVPFAFDAAPLLAAAA